MENHGIDTHLMEKKGEAVIHSLIHSMRKTVRKLLPVRDSKVLEKQQNTYKRGQSFDTSTQFFTKLL